MVDWPRRPAADSTTSEFGSLRHSPSLSAASAASISLGRDARRIPACRAIQHLHHNSPGCIDPSGTSTGAPKRLALALGLRDDRNGMAPTPIRLRRRPVTAVATVRKCRLFRVNPIEVVVGHQALLYAWLGAEAGTWVWLYLLLVFQAFLISAFFSVSKLARFAATRFTVRMRVHRELVR